MGGSRALVVAGLLVMGATWGIGCEGEKAPLAPEATSLEASKPAAPSVLRFAVDAPSSKVEFLMDAPKEKIRGRVSGAAGGELLVDPSDLTKTTGLVTVDLGKLELFQTVAGADGAFGAESKSEKQNEHALTWLEISPDTPAEVREKNAKAQFAIRLVEVEGETDLGKRSGSERRVNLKVTGEFLLHQRKVMKSVELAVTFRFQGNMPVNAVIRTVKPFAVGLAEHDVQPREAFGKLAQKTLEVLAPKVTKEALVSLDLAAGLSLDGGSGGMP
ncbi:hypothetical protein [Chondromyces crocatus]|uniref:Lipid/polyisoprenoid-binding YceI-like domain-containing protein n=1 Tax=Chondromyces crocatus TaxID=52 RepID=A0A0K1EJC6_CHOCO|nr:hypothetical protein [Chondromyces crocatus]AKT40777.1 uncharacterized protein CMC5_049330 [Chondromyces crocatus]